jgi:hypothetical protein
MRGGGLAGVVALAAPVLAAAALGACRHGAAPAAGDPRLWTRAERVTGTGRHHLPLPALALVATRGERAIAIVDGGGLAEVDLAGGDVVRVRLGAIDGVVRDATRVGDRVLAVGGARGRERAWWIDPRDLGATAIDLAPAGADPGGMASATGVAASADGRWVVITGRRLPLALRDPRTLAPARTLSPEPNWTAPAIVGDAFLVASHHGEMAAFDLDTGVENGRRVPVDVALVSADGLAAIQETARPPQLTDLHVPEHVVPLPGSPRAVAWSPDGQHAIVIGDDRVDLVDYPSGRTRSIDAPAAAARAVYSRTGAHAVVTARGALWRVAPASGATLTPPGPGWGAVSFVAPDGGGLVTATDRWRASGARGVTASGAWPGDGGGARVARSPGGGRIAAAAPDGNRVAVLAWDARTGVQVTQTTSDDVVDALAVADDGTIVVATPEAITRVTSDGQTRRLATARGGTVLALDAAAGRAVVARGGTIVVTDLGERRALAFAGAPDCDEDARAWLAPGAARLAIAAGPEVAIWDATRGVRIAAARLPGPARALAFAGDTVVIATDQRLVLWDPAGGAAASAIATPAVVTAIGADPRGDRIALGFGDGRAGVWRLAALRALARPVALGAGDMLRACPGNPLTAAP